MGAGNGSGSGRKRVYVILASVFAAGLILCGAWLVRYFTGLGRSSEELEGLKEAYVTSKDTGEAETSTAMSSNEQTASAVREKGPEEAGEEPEEYGEGGAAQPDQYGAPEKTIDFPALQAENADIYAWITVPGTPIDYPVLQHPETVDYYLKHNLNGSRGYPGCIYSELYNSKDWEDPNTVLYGHNMKNGTMFASLHRFADPEFFEENRYVYIYTPEGVRVYEIFAAYEFSNAHLLLGFDLSDPDNFAAYIEGVLQHDGLSDQIDGEAVVTNEDKLLTLSTCITNKPDSRYLVQAKLVSEE